MLANAMYLLHSYDRTPTEDLAWSQRRALIESYGLHLRNLCEFLFDEYERPARSTDRAAATDYLDRAQWTKNRDAAVSALRPYVIWIGASTQIAHLSYSRLRGGVNFHLLWGATVLMILNVFVNQVLADPTARTRLSESTATRLRTYIVRGLDAAGIPTGPNTEYDHPYDDREVPRRSIEP